MIGVKVVVTGLNVELTSVYLVPSPSDCQRPVPLQSLTNVDKSYVVSSLPFDGTGRHIIKRVLIVAANNRTSVSVEMPTSAANRRAGGTPTSGNRYVQLDEFESVGVESRDSDLSGLIIDATKPVFVSVSISSTLDSNMSSIVRPTHGGRPASKSEIGAPVQNEQNLSETNRRRTSPSPDVETISASRDAITSGRSKADGIDMAVTLQLGSVGRLGMTYVLVPTDGSGYTYRIAGT